MKLCAIVENTLGFCLHKKLSTQFKHSKQHKTEKLWQRFFNVTALVLNASVQSLRLCSKFRKIFTKPQPQCLQSHGGCSLTNLAKFEDCLNKHTPSKPT